MFVPNLPVFRSGYRVAQENFFLKMAPRVARGSCPETTYERSWLQKDDDEQPR